MSNATNIIVGAANLSVDGNPVGYTKDGVTLEMSADIEIVKYVDDSIAGSMSAIKKDEKFFVSTNLSESTLANLKIAWGINTEIVGNTLEFGGDNTVPEHILVFTGNAPGNLTTRTATFYKAISVEYGRTTYRKESEVLIPIKFRILLDKSKAAGKQLGKIEDA